jgi:Tfp pilus assembly protein PilN
MPNINLIAVRREEKKRLERLTRQLFFGLAGSVGVFVLLVLYLGAKRLTMMSDLREAEARMQSLQPKLDRIAQLEKDQDTIRPKVDTLQTAKTDTTRWRAVLQVISQSIPGDTWLSGLSTNVSGEDTTLSLSGTSASQSLVGETMTRIGSHPLFDRVDLRYTQAAPPTPGDPIIRVNFDIGAHLRSQAPPPADDKKNGKPAEGAQKADAGTAQPSPVRGGNTNG